MSSVDLHLGLDVGGAERTLHKACCGHFGRTFFDSMGCHGVSGQLLRVVEGSRLICYLKQLRTIVAVKALIPANAD
ncbi:hypothetical protein, partial [Burkholderia pseudomallei]|uniref:hypothetical protein n=1 Tax=Burkholderia pseudomallei TaxID=28450 RepID=UPI001C4D1B8A